MTRKVIICGSGPAGLTAAIYTGRGLLQPLVIGGRMPGGQLTLTSEVENYPGFREGIEGPELMRQMREQAERFGAEILMKEATGVELSRRPLVVDAEGETFEAHALIIATGASARMLGLDSERQLLGAGVSVCATCDGFFFRGQEVVVVGGGDSAMEEAIFLTRYAERVYVVHRRDALRASKILQERAFANEKIEFVWNSVVEDILDVAQGKVVGVRLRNVKEGSLSERKCDGVFLAIGHEPNTAVFRGQLELDEKGYVVRGEGAATSVPGVFAAGDVHDSKYRQAVTAAGCGCMAAMDCERWLSEQGLR